MLLPPWTHQRKLVLPSNMAVLLADTVGFVSRLPHNLVEALQIPRWRAAWSDVIVLRGGGRGRR